MFQSSAFPAQIVKELWATAYTNMYAHTIRKLHLPVWAKDTPDSLQMGLKKKEVKMIDLYFIVSNS